jgi:hypothetical protein
LWRSHARHGCLQLAHNVKSAPEKVTRTTMANGLPMAEPQAVLCLWKVLLEVKMTKRFLHFFRNFAADVDVHYTSTDAEIFIRTKCAAPAQSDILNVQSQFTVRKV